MKTKLFYTRLLARHLTGCDHYYQVFSIASGKRVADIDGSNRGRLYFPETDWIEPNELADLVKLVAKVINHVQK